MHHCESRRPAPFEPIHQIPRKSSEPPHTRGWAPPSRLFLCFLFDNIYWRDGCLFVCVLRRSSPGKYRHVLCWAFFQDGIDIGLALQVQRDCHSREREGQPWRRTLPEIHDHHNGFGYVHLNVLLASHSTSCRYADFLPPSTNHIIKSQYHQKKLPFEQRRADFFISTVNEFVTSC